MLLFVVCRKETGGTEVCREDLIFTFELSPTCPEAYSSSKEALFSPFTEPEMKEQTDWPFKVN